MNDSDLKRKIALIFQEKRTVRNCILKRIQKRKNQAAHPDECSLSHPWTLPAVFQKYGFACPLIENVWFSHRDRQLFYDSMKFRMVSVNSFTMASSLRKISCLAVGNWAMRPLGTWAMKRF